MTHPPMDKDNFCRQVLASQDAMFRVAKSILRRDQDAEDAVQEAICAAYAARGSLRDPERFRPWLLRIVANQCYAQCRRRRPEVDLADIQDFLAAPEPDMAERLALWQAVLLLGDDTRAAVTLFYYEDLPIRDISAVLGVSEAAVKTRLCRGRARLKELLNEK